MYLMEPTLLNQKFPQDQGSQKIYSSVYIPAATAPKYMFPRIDDLPLSVSIVSPNKFQIYQNLFLHRAGDHLAWLADNASWVGLKAM